MVKVKVVNIKPVETASNETQPSEATREEVISEPEEVKTEPEVVQEVVKEVEPVPEEVKNVKTKKAPATGKCDNCGKEMLEKTFRYYHQLKCKPKESTPIEQHKQAEHRPENIS